jgi:hypothetical protein
MRAGRCGDSGHVSATKEEAGYSFAGGSAHVRYVAASVYLRDPSQYSASVGALGWASPFNSGVAAGSTCWVSLGRYR